MGQWRNPPCCKGAADMQAGLLCNLPTSLGGQAAGERGRATGQVAEARTYAVAGKWVRGRKGWMT